MSLDQWFHDDFAAGQKDTYKVQGFDVGEMYFVELHSDQGGSLWEDPDWFVNKVTVISSSQDQVDVFPCYRWIIQDITLFHGKGEQTRECRLLNK